MFLWHFRDTIHITNHQNHIFIHDTWNQNQPYVLTHSCPNGALKVPQWRPGRYSYHCTPKWKRQQYLMYHYRTQFNLSFDCNGAPIELDCAWEGLHITGPQQLWSPFAQFWSVSPIFWLFSALLTNFHHLEPITPHFNLFWLQKIVSWLNQSPQ